MGYWLCRVVVPLCLTQIVLVPNVCAARRVYKMSEGVLLAQRGSCTEDDFKLINAMGPGRDVGTFPKLQAECGRASWQVSVFFAPEFEILQKALTPPFPPVQLVNGFWTRIQNPLSITWPSTPTSRISKSYCFFLFTPFQIQTLGPF